MSRNLFYVILIIAFMSASVFSCSGDDDDAKAPSGDDDATTDDDDNDDNDDDDNDDIVEIVMTITADSHSIVIGKSASPSEIHAAEDLQLYFNECFGSEINIYNEPPATVTAMIILGAEAAAEKLQVEIDEASLGEQGFVIKTAPPHLVIAGTQQSGTMYGVTRFLKDYFGVRWYAPGVTYSPELKEVELPAIDKLEQPAFFWRKTSYRWPGKDDDFEMHVGQNEGKNDADSPYGKKYSHDGRAHSYFRFINPDEYFDEHPEYFSEIGGVRTKDDTQLCLTNPDVLDIVTEKMLQRMADMPDVQQHNFSQMDHYNNCQCEKCRKMNEEYGSAGGTQFWFVNQLAERTSKVYPDKLIGTLAYMYTEEPPKNLEMHPNVAVWLCHMFPSCDSHPIETCPLNADYKRRALAWSELVEHLYIWHYIVDFAHYYNPFPNFTAMAADMKFYKNIGVEGIYLQAMGHGGGGGEFSLLRPYLGMELLWNPEIDAVALRKDFLQGYYGDASQPIENYIEMLHEKVEKDNVHMHLYSNPGAGHLTDDIMAKAHEYFDEAENAVKDDPEMLERVKVARMPLVYADYFPRNGFEIKRESINWLHDMLDIEEVQEFLDRMETHGFTTTREVSGDTDTFMMLFMLMKSYPDIITISNEYLKVEIVPDLGGRALRIIDIETDECITSYNVKEGMLFPFTGGLEDRTGDTFRFYGWVLPSSVTHRSKNSLTLSKTTLDDYELERTMTLEPGSRVITIETKVTNPSDEPRNTRLRSHIELDLGDVYTTEVEFTSRSGEKISHDMEPVIAGLREGIHYYDIDAPDASWSFTGSKGFKVTQTFDNEQIDFATVWSFPDTFNEVEAEIWAYQKVLEPGESLYINQTLAVEPVE